MNVDKKNITLWKNVMWIVIKTGKFCSNYTRVIGRKLENKSVQFNSIVEHYAYSVEPRLDTGSCWSHGWYERLLKAKEMDALIFYHPARDTTEMFKEHVRLPPLYLMCIMQCVI